MRRLLVLAALIAAPAAAQDIDAGRAAYLARCQACHGKDGKGDGPATAALPTPPPDMTTTAFWRGRTDVQIAAVLETGSPKGVMRPYPMRPQQQRNLIAYLRTFAPPD